MGLLERILNFRRTKDPRSPDERRLAYRPQTRAGVAVTPDNALTIPAVFACIRYLSQTVASLPWHVMRETELGPEPAPTHPVDYLLHKRPSPDYSSFTFRELMVRWAVLWGNAYAEIERDAVGRPAALHPLHPTRVDPKRDEETGRLYFRVSNGTGGTVDIDANDIFHLKGFGGDGPFGLNIVEFAAETLGYARAAQLFGAAFFGTGANPSGVVKVKNAMSVEALTELERRFAHLHRGPSNAGKTLFLDNEADYQPLSTSPEQGQFIETQQHIVEDVARLFGVPPHKIGHLLRSTFSNIEHQAIEAVQDSILPWVRKLEDEADFKMFGRNRQGFFTKLNVNGLLRGDSAARAAFYRSLAEIGVLSINEIRKLEDLAAIGEEGDKRLVNGAYTPLDKVGEEPIPAPQPVTEEPQE